MIEDEREGKEQTEFQEKLKQIVLEHQRIKNVFVSNKMTHHKSILSSFGDMSSLLSLSQNGDLSPNDDNF